MSEGSMVERVARALNDYGDDPPDWNGEMDDGWRESFRAMARVAIEAMREPTPQMLDVVEAKSTYPLGSSTPTDSPDPDSAWRLMIDAALQDTVPDGGGKGSAPGEPRLGSTSIHHDKDGESAP